MTTSDRLDYGIDLGTTNSVIARMQRGRPVVVKNDFQADATPSVIAFRGSRIRVGKLAHRQLQNDRLSTLKRDEELRSAFAEFKRTMGTDQRSTPATVSETSMTSEELSAEVLKELRRSVTDAEVNAAVVTIPAAFGVVQQQATLRAAELAGLRQCLLLQEPVAAAMAYGILEPGREREKWLVFDFGGGTFDAALALVEDGQITVKDTEGDNYLGGKDLDRAVVEQIFLAEVARELDISDYLATDPRRGEWLRDALKRWAEQANIRLSTRESHEVLSEVGEIELADGRDVDLDFEITRQVLRPVVTPIFQRAIDKAKILLARHGLSGADLDELILIGGPTYSPILRDMLAEQIRSPNTSVDPITVVARGAAVFASTVPLNRDLVRSKDSTVSLAVHLDVGYEATSISREEFATVKYHDPSDRDRLGNLTVELVRAGWRSGGQPLGEHGALFELDLEENRANVFDIVASTARGDAVAPHPSEITIIHGTKVTGSPLTHHLGVEVWDKTRTHRVFWPLKGAEKSKPLPVTGTKSGLSTPSEIRPGVSTDRLLIRIYDGETDARGVPVALCSHVMALVLTGDQVNRVIPAGTKFDLTVVTQSSSGVPEAVRVLFPTLDDEEYELEIPSEQQRLQTSWVRDELGAARARIDEIRASGQQDIGAVDDVEAKITAAAARLDEVVSDSDQTGRAIARLKESLRKLYAVVDASAWSIALTELEEAWNDLRRANRDEGYQESRREMREAKRRYEEVRASGDPGLARDLIDDLRRAVFNLKRCEIANDIIEWGRHAFGQIRWKNPGQARQAVDEAMRAKLADRPCSELLVHAQQILDLTIRESEGDARPPVPYLDDFVL